MADPLAVGGAIVGGALDLFSGLSAANAARRWASYQAALQEQNAVYLDYAAGDAVARGQFGEGVARLHGGQKIGAQRAGYAASGVDVQSGSAVQVEGQTAAMTELDAQVIRNNAMREAWGYKTQAAQARFGAKLSRATGEAKYAEAVLSGVVGAATHAIPLLRIGGGGDTGPAPYYGYEG